MFYIETFLLFILYFGSFSPPYNIIFCAFTGIFISLLSYSFISLPSLFMLAILALHINERLGDRSK